MTGRESPSFTSAADLPDDALLANALLGGGLSDEAKRHLGLAGLMYQQDSIAEMHLREAETHAPGHAAVLIGLYRFYFYKGRLEDALAVAERCLVKAATDNQLPSDWRDVQPGQARFDRYDDIVPRFFLFSLKGYAYLQMRLGRLDLGRAAIDKLLALDPTDKIGARVLLGVLDRQEVDDD